MDVAGLQAELRAFAQARDWEQFHHPKNLAMALAGESGELVELYQWLTETESREARSNVELARATSRELADILIYAAQLADVMGIDLDAAVAAKIESNERRYPVATSKGTAQKHP